MSEDMSARDAALELFEDRVREASNKGLDSIPCDSCGNDAQIIILTTVGRSKRILAQCQNYHDPINGRNQKGPGCGNPKVMMTG